MLELEIHGQTILSGKQPTFAYACFHCAFCKGECWLNSGISRLLQKTVSMHPLKQSWLVRKDGGCCLEQLMSGLLHSCSHYQSGKQKHPPSTEIRFQELVPLSSWVKKNPGTTPQEVWKDIAGEKCPSSMKDQRWMVSQRNIPTVFPKFGPTPT